MTRSFAISIDNVGEDWDFLASELQAILCIFFRNSSNESTSKAAAELRIERLPISIVSNCMQFCSERWNGRMSLSFCIAYSWKLSLLSSISTPPSFALSALKNIRRRKYLIKASSNTGHDSISSSVSSSNQCRANFCYLTPRTVRRCSTLRGLRQYGPFCATTARRPHPQRLISNGDIWEVSKVMI